MKKQLNTYIPVIVFLAFILLDALISTPEDFDNTPKLAFISQEIIGAHCSSL